ncbi:doubled motif LPXTG anchor domain-containing protein [Clostridium sp. Marseille-P2415]|uniref:doubled motif LPXTG anchor domain-containing protein n=1 Tax=Clostridium sp. Marseille-P2415 TaxID=1805471 RepID=UPI0009884538|nr:doubled motif LPXTG anchor domain-containing protein [Clostridium sp. Marseille-P2415]
MKGAIRNVHRLKRVIAWLLTAAIVTGNISQLTVTTAYAAETSERKTASSSNAGKASPSEATPSEARRIIDVRVTQSAIEKVLKKDFDNRPELKEELVPFEGEQKELVIQKLYEELEEKTLVLQKKVGKAMYMVVVSDTLDGEPFFETEKSERIKQESALQNVRIIGVNGYKDRECEFRLRILGDDLTVTNAELEEYEVVGENAQEEAVTKTSAAGDHSGSSGIRETTAVTEGETKADETNVAEKNSTEPVEEIREKAGEVKTDDTADETEDAAEDSIEAVEASEDVVHEEDVNQEEEISNDNASDDEKSDERDAGADGEAVSISRRITGADGVTLTKHEVPVLFRTADSLATDSEAAGETFYQEEPDIISVGETRVLSEEERAALMGTDADEGNDGKKSVSLFSFTSQPSFSMVVRSLGITTLNTEVSGEEEKLTPYETALTYYGPDSTEKKDTVEINLAQSKTGSIKAGILYTYTITYTMQAAPLYEYAAGGKLSLFDTYENSRIEFTVPAGIALEEQAGKVKLISSNGNSKVYEIRVGDEQNAIRPGKSDSIAINAFIDGNGERAVGEHFKLPEDSVAFYADVKVADKTDKDNVTYPGNIETVTYAEQPENTSLILQSDDVWHIKKRVYPNDQSYTVVRDDAGNPEFVDITYLIEMGIYGSSGEISRQPGGTIYQTYGRTGFLKDSFQITDSLKITTPNAPEAMKPVSVTAKWGDGSKVNFTDNPDGSITIDEFKTQGQNAADHIFVSESAPTYSSYLVTARYPYEPFLLKYNDERAGDDSVFTVNNYARLEYTKLGTAQKVTEDSAAAVAIHEVNKPAVIKIKKEIDEGVGVIQKYGLAMEKEYPGMAGFEIFSLDSDNKRIPYTNYTVIDRYNKKIDSDKIVVNPSNGETENGYYTTGEDGSIRVQVDPGTYVIKEVNQPVGTEFSSAAVGTAAVGKEEDIKVTLKAGETAEVTVINGVIGKGAIEFYKKARTWNSADLADKDLNSLEGAEFSLYQKNKEGKLEEVKTVKSDGNGAVLFKPVTPGQYVVREKSANGYIVDTKDYAVTVAAGQTSPIRQNGNFIVNTLNEAKVNVKKWIQNDQGGYSKVPESFRGDFNDRFWFEKSTDGITWTKVSIDSRVTYSLDGSSRFMATLPVSDGDNRKILYRVAEEVPEGYSDGNGYGNGYSCETKDNRTYVYKTFSLEPLKTAFVDLKNNKGGTLKLQKEAWSINYGSLDKNASKRGFQFKLYAAFKYSGYLYEVSPGTIYTTDSNGEITVKGLDVTKDYYWCEVGSDGRLEVDDTGKMRNMWTFEGIKPFIGPYEVNRESDTSVKAYNIPQKIPYWLYKTDITDKDNDISAEFEITKKGSGEVVWKDYVSRDGRYVSLDPGTTYTVEEITPPFNFEKSGNRDITTPSGPVTREKLEKWFGENSKETRLTFENKPYKSVLIRKIQYYTGDREDESARIPFEVYVKNNGKFGKTGSLYSNELTPLAPGTYYFKEVVPSGFINSYYLLSDKAEGIHPDYEVRGTDVYYGPVIVTAASAANEKNQEINLGKGNKPLENYQDYGKVTVTKKDALRNTALKGAVLGIFRADQFDVNHWADSIKKPIQKLTTSGNGQVTFDSRNLKIFDGSGNRISYVIAEITPPTGYLQSYEILTTALKEGTVITTVNGDAGGSALVIQNEPKLTIRTQKYWQDEWSYQFYPVDHVLGNVKLALYKVNQAGIAEYVKTETTNAYDGIATFYDINRNDTYYVVEVRVPTREETGFGFDLNMKDKTPLAEGNGEPPKTLSAADLEAGKYNAVKYTGKDLVNTADSLIQYTGPLYNYKPWVQFHILKTCDGIAADGTRHTPEPVNGAKFTLYKMKAENKNLSKIKLEDLEDETQFEKVDNYESGTRIDPATEKRADGQFDTAILETGKVYWLVEEEAAPGYKLPGGRQIVAVFAPENSGYKDYKGMLHLYKSGRNEKIAVVKNQHGEDPGGLSAYYFQIALNKWLGDDTKPNAEPTLLGGAKFRIWLVDPETKEKLLPIEVVETGLESDDHYKTGYALSQMINMGKLKTELENKGLDPEKVLKLDEGREQVKAVFALEEVYAPSKVQMDTTLHYLEAAVPKNKDYIDEQYFWKTGKPEAFRLINKVSGEYPVTFVKYGYRPDTGTFGKTDEELAGLDIDKTPLSGVKFEVWQYQWKDTGYSYVKTGTYTTGSDGRVTVPGGLKAGHYRLKETLTGGQQKKYITMYTGQSNLWRYFTVGSTPSTVTVYNPEKPDLEIEKTTWNGDPSISLNGIAFTIQKSGSSEIKAVTGKMEDGRFAASFKNLDSGVYTIKGEALSVDAAKAVTNVYFETSAVNVGYMAKAEGEKVYLTPAGDSVTGKTVSAAVKNPRLAELVIHKTDAETKESGPVMAGASFQLEYLKFRSGTDLIGGVLQNVQDEGYQKPEQGFEAISGSLTDNGDGTYALKDCSPGWYRITEQKAPEGYTAAAQPMVTAVVGDMAAGYEETADVTFENRKKAELTVTKRLDFGDGFRNDGDIAQKLPAEIVFDVYTYSDHAYKRVLDEGNKPVQVKIRNFRAQDGYYTAAGTVLLPQNPEGGAYYLKEQENPDWMIPAEGGIQNGTLWADGYIQAGTGAEFTSGSPVSVVVNNQYAKAKVSLTKVDGADPSKKLSGAAFKLYSDPDLTKEVGDFTEIGQSGVYEIVFSTKSYNPGTYYVREVNAPAGYIAIQTAIPAEGLTVETGMESPLTVQNQGGIDLQITKYSGNGGTESLKAGLDFELYRKSGSGPWNYVAGGTTDSGGELAFRGLELPAGDSYAVYEVTKKEQGFETYRMASFEGEEGTILPTTADVIKNGETITGVDLYVLTGSGTVSPGVYGFKAHNQEALPLKLIKNDVNKSDNPDGAITAFMKVTDAETRRQVGDLIAVPYGETGTTIQLLPGTYEIEETAVTRNSQGYVINKDDARTIYKKEVTIKEGEIPGSCEFTNVKQKTGVTLDKTSSAAALKDLWWNDGQTVTYTLTPNVTNSIPLDQFVINDTGLQMLDAGKNVLSEDEYTYEKYTITSVKPGKAAEQNRIRDAKTGTIMADVTFYDFNGNQVGEVQSVRVSGDGEISPVKPAGGKKVRSFRISYRNDTLKGSTENQYVLGQDFVPGSVEVTVKLSRQDAKLSNGNYKKEIKYIRNQADATMYFRKWDWNGTLTQGQETSEARKDCDLQVVQSQAPVISVKKSVDPVRSIQPDDTLTYTLYVKNATTSDDSGIVPMRRPVLIDHVPPGVTVSGESNGENRLLKAVELKDGPKGVTIEKTIRKVDAKTGQETLFIQLDGELKKGESVTVQVKSQIAGSIINYGKNILNELYVTSDVLQPAFSLNQTGASFMIETLTGSKWPSADLPKDVQLPDEKYRTYGYASDSAENTMSTGTGLILHKEVKGNLDTRFVSGTTVGKVAKSAEDGDMTDYDGTVLYRLTVNNASATDFVTQLQLMDILPVKGDYSTGNFERLSDYRLGYENIQSIAIENRTDNTAGRKVRGFDYQVTYSGEAFQNKETTRAGRDSMLNDNSDGFWNGGISDPTAIRIKITDPGFYLAPGENLVVTYKAAVPYTTMKELDEEAYGYAVNDFATSYSYKKNLSETSDTKFSQVQTSNAVQVVLVPGNVKVSGRIWIDDNNNGIQDESIEKDHLLTDLLPVLQSGYFNVSLLKYSKSGDDEAAGTAGLSDARFLFDGLTPAKPFGITGSEFTKEQEDSWYSGQSLIPSKLKGEDPAHYRIYVTTGTMPEGYEDLVLKLAKPVMLATGVNQEAGRSRLPQTLAAGGSNYGESLDSNFNEVKGSYASEDFFLWSAGDDYDKTKDIGFVPYRNVTIKKINQAGNPVEGAHFRAYGPFTNEEMKTFRETGITDASILGAPAAEGSTVLSDGEAVWNAGELLYYRNYIIVEDGAPAGYQIADARTGDMSVMESYQVNGQKAWVLPSKEFKTAENAVPSTITVQNSYVSGMLEFTKEDGLTGKELAGAAFRIEKNGTVVEDAWKAFTAAMKADPDSMGVAEVEATDSSVDFEVASGKVTLTGIPFGSYTLSEIRVPDGYDITKKPADMTFHIETDGQKAVLADHEGNIIKNTRTEYGLSLKKADNAGNDKVSGIKFAIYGPGKYGNSSWIPFGKTKFKLNDPSGNGYEVKETNAEGLVTWNLPYGDYRIEESDAAGYETVEPFYVRIDANGTVSLLDAEDRSELTLNSADQKQINVAVTNEVRTGELSIEKVDRESREAIAGAQFELSGTSVIEGAFAAYQKHVTGLGVSGVSAGNDGGRLWIRFQVDGSSDSKTGLLTQIPYGSYTLKEIKAPEGYLFSSGSEWTREFNIESDEGIRLTGNDAVVNIPHELNIEKRDKVTDEVLSGAVFVLMNADGKYVSLNEDHSYSGFNDSELDGSRFTTGNDGRVTIKRLPAGNYILKEIEAPANYAVSADQPVTVLQSGNTETVIVYDVRNRAQIRINKVASHDHERKLGGAVFGIYSDEGLTALAGTMTTGNDGFGESEMLPLGTYYVKEQKAPAGYEASDRVYEVTLKDDSQVFTVRADGSDFITNDYGTGSLVFDKVDRLTGEALASARFSLTGKETEVDGAFDHFAANLVQRSQEELEAMGISGVETEASVIRFTAVNGHVSMEGLPYGTYTLKEENAPKGYLSLNGKAEFTFTITEDQKAADLGNGNQVVNERAQFELRLKKVDDLGRSISGMQFEILGPGRYEEEGILSVFGAGRFNASAESDTGLFTTDGDGLILLGLKHGDYRIREISSGRYDPIGPFYIRIDEEGNGSILKDNSGAAAVSKDSSVTLTITNKISTGNLELEKVDSENTDKRLNGAEFTLTNLSTLVPGAWDSYRYQAASEGASWTTGDVAGNTITFVLSGRGVITNLPYGTYRLTETKAPDGYILGSEPWTAEFTVNETSKVIRHTAPVLFTKTNGAIANMPSKITVIKTNAVYADTKLGGAGFILKASDGRYVKLNGGSFDGYTDEKASAGTFVTDSDGQFIIKRLPKDTYTFIETKAPSGYYINDHIPPVTLDGINSFTITIQDEKIRNSGGDSGGGRSPGGSSGGDPSNGPGVVTIIPDQVPLAGLPGDGSVDLLNIDDGNVPLANLPKTGERKNAAGKVMVALSGFMMALYAALSKKKKEN